MLQQNSLTPDILNWYVQGQLLSRKHNIYLTTNVLREIEDQGRAVGRPPYIANTNLNFLNQDIDTRIGYADNI